jgi:hypothetical protein
VPFWPDGVAVKAITSTTVTLPVSLPSHVTTYYALGVDPRKYSEYLHVTKCNFRIRLRLGIGSSNRTGKNKSIFFYNGGSSIVDNWRKTKKIKSLININLL